MTQPIRNLRLRPFTTSALASTTANNGDVYYDSTNKTLRVFDAATVGGVSLARADLVNVTNQQFLAKALSAGVSSGVQSGQQGRLAYYPNTAAEVNDLAEVYWHMHDSTEGQLHVTGTVSVSGQKNFMRFHWDTLADLNAEADPVIWHGMVAHVHDTGKLYYAHAGVWVPVASESSIANSFGSLAVTGQDTVAADIQGDTLTLVAGANITITTDASTDTVTIAAQANTGSITFQGTTIDSADSSAITVTPTVIFDSDIAVGTDILFPDGTRLSSAAALQGPPGPTGPQGPAGATGSGAGDVISSGGSYVDNAVVRYDGVTGTIIQVSSATISDAGLLTAVNFSGGGAAITALNAANLASGTIPDARFPATLPAASGTNLTALNATQLTSGTVPDARFPATLPAASGTNLTALNATQLTSGTVPIARLGSSGTPSASTYLRGDNTWATVSQGAAASDSFTTIAVAGQSSVVADSSTDTLTLVAGTNITITTDASTDTITINSTGGGGGVASNSFETIAVTGQSSVVADSSTDTLTLTAGTGITITTNASTDTITITNNVANFTGLTDVGNTSLTVDQIYLPAITRLNVTNNGSSSYRFDQYGSTDNPSIYAITATTIAFNLNVPGHPFLIQSGGVNFNTGLTHVSTSGVVSTGNAAQGQTSGTLYWKIPYGQGSVAYKCSLHGAMNGVILMKAIESI